MNKTTKTEVNGENTSFNVNYMKTSDIIQKPTIKQDKEFESFLKNYLDSIESNLKFLIWIKWELRRFANEKEKTSP